MSEIIPQETIERAKSWLEQGNTMNIMEFIRDSHLVATVFFRELDRQAIHQGFQFLLPLLQADEASLWLDARMKVLPDEPTSFKQGEIGDDPKNQEVLIITHAKRGVGVDIAGLPYNRDEDGNIIEWEDDTLDGTSSISPFADAAHEGLNQEGGPIEQMLKASRSFGLTPAEARVRADCAVLKMYAQSFDCLLALGRYEDEILNDHLASSFSGGGFDITDEGASDG